MQPCPSRDDESKSRLAAKTRGEAAKTLGITASRLKTLGLVDKVVGEPMGGAHRDYPAMMNSVRKALQDTLKQVQARPANDLLQARFNRLMGYEIGRAHV